MAYHPHKNVGELASLVRSSRMEQVVDMRSILGETAKDYVDAVAKLQGYKADQFRVTCVLPLCALL